MNWTRMILTMGSFAATRTSIWQHHAHPILSMVSVTMLWQMLTRFNCVVYIVNFVLIQFRHNPNRLLECWLYQFSKRVSCTTPCWYHCRVCWHVMTCSTSLGIDIYIILVRRYGKRHSHHGMCSCQYYDHIKIFQTRHVLLPVLGPHKDIPVRALFLQVLGSYTDIPDMPLFLQVLESYYDIPDILYTRKCIPYLSLTYIIIPQLSHSFLLTHSSLSILFFTPLIHILNTTLSPYNLSKPWFT